MINLLALFLVVSSLVSAGVWSPTPEKQQQEDVIVKQGHRVVVVEYDQQGQHHTKVSISPEHEDLKPEISSTRGSDQLICDAYGKCTHRIATAIGKAKDKVSEAKESAMHKAQNVKEGAKQTAAGIAEDFKEGANESLSKAKSATKETKDIGEDLARNLTNQVREVRDSFVEKAKEAKQGSEHAAKRVQSSLHNVFDKIGRHLNGLISGLGGAMNGLMGMMNLLGFATAYGMCVWVTFISSYVLAGALPRQQFGIVQSKIYPVYFRAMAASIGLALLGHTLPRLFKTKADMFQAANLLGSLLTVLSNSMYLEPRATKVMFERMKVEKEEGRGREDIVPETSRAAETATTTTRTDPQDNPEQEVVRSKLSRLSERLKKLNTYSSILNILTLMSLSLHLVYLGWRLDRVC
ncbi:hypothetical protein LWI28_013353 [Acer negundo]|uniref:TMEM205-like domain-containing protein n=1 Tax=Acer negundo TaxID=4023 RepID=A0AAD5P590_ACENE|nr:hypothetical protein LWI28_013353 [Acer negundo]KAK4859761.1 hypothetical protein QYF36_011236 [Acer negundo]